MRPSSATVLLPSPAVGARMRERRLAARLSQREAAEMIGVTKRAYQRWESGDSGVTAENADRIEKVLDTTIDWLHLGDELSGIDSRDSAELEEIGRQVQEVRAAVVRDPAAGDGGFIVEALLDIQGRLERIEAALAEGGLMGTADGDELVDATRQAKAALAAGLDAEDAARASRSERGTPREGDATQGSARAPRAGTPRSAAKRAR